MCYGSAYFDGTPCEFESWDGECTKGSRLPCPILAEEREAAKKLEKKKKDRNDLLELEDEIFVN